MARGGNAIGSASVILSANADGFASGLTKGEKRLDQFGVNVSNKLNKFSGSAGGGIGAKLLKLGSGSGRLAGILGGGAAGIAGGALAGGAVGASLGSLGGPAGAAIGGIAGALAGLGAGGARAGFNLIQGLPDLFERLKGSAQGANLSTLTGVTNSFDRLEAAGDNLLTKILVPLAPAIAMAADSATEFLGKIGPGLEFAADAGSALLFTGLEIGKMLADAAIDTAKWAAEWLGLSDAGVTGSGLMFDALRKVANGVGYVWDAFKLGGGVIVTIVGKVLEGLGDITTATGAAIHKFAALADKLPSLIRPGWIAEADQQVNKWGNDLSSLGAKWATYGANLAFSTWTNFGDSGKRFSDGIGDIENRFNAKRSQLANTPVFTDPKFIGAMERGSKEAYSTEAYNRFGRSNTKDPSAIMQENGKKLDRVASAVERIEKEFRGASDKIETF
jgi:hypothetical protein